MVPGRIRFERFHELMDRDDALTACQSLDLTEERGERDQIDQSEPAQKDKTDPHIAQRLDAGA